MRPIPVEDAEFQSTPSVWRETLSDWVEWDGISISIHSLRVEGDGLYFYNYSVENGISIHSLRVEGDRSRRSVGFED